MTLSGWLRDYIYISLGGNRRGSSHLRESDGDHAAGRSVARRELEFRDLGRLHGAALAIERAVWGGCEERKREGLIRIPLTVLTFGVVCVAWVFFRAENPRGALYVVGQMFSGTTGALLLSPIEVELAMATLLVALAEEYGGLLTRLGSSPLWVRTAATVVALLAIELFTASDRTIPFVYFQF